MSRLLADGLPDSIRAELQSPAPQLVAVPLLTVDDDGFPNVALLSYFELGLADDSCYFWLYSPSSSTRCLQARSVCTLIFASPDGIFYVKGNTTRVLEIDGQRVFNLVLHKVFEDLPSPAEGDAALLSGLQFQLPEAVIAEKVALKSRVLRLVQP